MCVFVRVWQEWVWRAPLEEKITMRWCIILKANGETVFASHSFTHTVAAILCCFSTFYKNIFTCFIVT